MHMKTADVIRLAFCFSMWWIPQLAEASVAGRFLFVAGEVKVISAEGEARAAQKGGEVAQGETIRTSALAFAQVRMADDGFIVVRPGTELRVAAFVYNGKADGTERSVISLAKGGFRAITGEVGRSNKENYEIQTPTAIIRIRGTDHEPFYLPAAIPGQDSPFEHGTYDRVSSGAAVIFNERGMVVINPSRIGFAPNPLHAAPKLLPDVPAFYWVETERNAPGVSSIEELAKLKAINATLIRPIDVPYKNLFPPEIAPPVFVPPVIIPAAYSPRGGCG